MSEQAEHTESTGRIEVAPEVLVTIAHHIVERNQGVERMSNPPADIVRRFRRGMRQDGVVLDLSDNKVQFNIYVIMEPHVNLLETSREIQDGVTEAIDTMIGIPVDAVNVFVEDVHYAQGEVA